MEEDYAVEFENIKKHLIDLCCNKELYTKLTRGNYLELPAMVQLCRILALISKKSDKKTVSGFCKSKYFSTIPFVRLTALLYAFLKKRIRYGFCKTKADGRLRGIWFDIEFLSTYAPYCDAVFTDRTMHQITTEASMKYPDDFPFKIFSAANFTEFENYLEMIEESKPSYLEKLLTILYK